MEHPVQMNIFTLNTLVIKKMQKDAALMGYHVDSCASTNLLFIFEIGLKNYEEVLISNQIPISF